jgi:hypothetical protein
MRAALRPVLHPATTAGVLLALAAAGLALHGHPARAVPLLAVVAGAAAGFANSGST